MRRLASALVALGIAVPAVAQPLGAGAATFTEKCAMCHRTHGMGTVLLSRRMEPRLAPLEARADLDPAAVRAVVRGGLGNMPRISRGEVSDAQLAAIAAYLTRKKPT